MNCDFNILLGTQISGLTFYCVANRLVAITVTLFACNPKQQLFGCLMLCFLGVTEFAHYEPTRGLSQ